MTRKAENFINNHKGNKIFSLMSMMFGIILTLTLETLGVVGAARIIGFIVVIVSLFGGFSFYMFSTSMNITRRRNMRYSALVLFILNITAMIVMLFDINFYLISMAVNLLISAFVVAIAERVTYELIALEVAVHEWWAYRKLPKEEVA